MVESHWGAFIRWPFHRRYIRGSSPLQAVIVSHGNPKTPGRNQEIFSLLLNQLNCLPIPILASGVLTMKPASFKSGTTCSL